MTLLEYRIFHTVTQQGSFARAAQILHLTPSAISHAVSSMEESCGFSLFVRGKGGLVAHLGTSNAIEVEKRIEEGNSHAKLVYDGMLYSNVRAIGALAAAADGKIDRIILTGGLAHSKYVAAYITKKVSFIAPVEVMAGEFELEALAAGACRVLDGEEKAKDFSKLLEKA